MKICAISDIHGSLIEIPECDVLCICGDILPLEIQDNLNKSKDWMLNKFIPWCENQSCKKVLWIAGNHDFLFERVSGSDYDVDKVMYLQDLEFVYEGIKFYGSPWCKMFGDWAFMIYPHLIKEKFEKMPDDVNVLLTHDAPYGASDIVLEDTPWTDGKHIGNPQFAETIATKKPDFNLHGHLHSTNHNCEILGNTKVYNVSVKNEKYEVKFNPLIIEI